MVHIITDTTACVSSEYARQHNLPVIPQIVTFGEESFYEGIELDQSGFLERLRKASQLPKTAAPPPELFRAEFERLVPLGEPILCVHPSTHVSGTVRSAEVAAQDFPEADIRVIDTRLVAGPLMSLVMKAVAWAEDGLDIDTIQTRILDLIPRCHIYFLVDTLEYLARGGRIGAASALLGSLLQVKPILTLQDGVVTPYEKQRTHQRAVMRLVEIVREQYPDTGDGCPVVMHAGAPQEAARLVEHLTGCLQVQEIPIVDLPPAIVVHAGPGILAVSFIDG